MALDLLPARLPGRGRGSRNVLRGDGYFSIDFSLSKAWTMPWSQDQRLRFRWDTFNLTNTPSFDVAVPGRVSRTAQNTFGRYYNTHRRPATAARGAACSSR